jgi:hypothetical protein
LTLAVTFVDVQVEALMNDVAVLTFERNVVDAFGDFRGMPHRRVNFRVT